MNDPELRAYLLGRLPEAAAQSLEERLLEEDELFETLRGVEDDLVDDYAQGRLDAADARAFAERQPGRTDRVRFSRALSQRSARPKVVPFPGPRWLPFAVAATVVLGLGVPFLMRVEVQAPTRLPMETRPPTPPSEGEVTTVAVAIATSRSAGPENPVILPGKARALRLRIAVDPGDRFDGYRVDLREPSGAVFYAAENLRARSETGILTLEAEMPAGGLLEGAYELAVMGMGPGGRSEPLGFATIRIRRSP